MTMRETKIELDRKGRKIEIMIWSDGKCEIRSWSYDRSQVRTLWEGDLDREAV